MDAEPITELPPERVNPGGQNGDRMRARLHGMWTAVAGSWGEHADVCRTRAEGPRGTAARIGGAQAGRSRARARVRRRRTGDRRRRADGPRGGRRAVGRRRRDDVDRGGTRCRPRPRRRHDPRPGPRAHRPARRFLRRRPLPRGTHVRAGSSRAAREIRRVLRPGGRVALAVWGPRDRNPWLGIIFDAVSAQLGRPVPPPGVPGPFSLADADGLAALLTGAGLADVVRRATSPCRSAPPRSTSGGRGRPRSQDRSRGSSPACPLMSRRRCARGSAMRRARMRRLPDSSSPDSRCSQPDAASVAAWRARPI